jgi:predicted nicotinamide N-methyase
MTSHTSAPRRAGPPDPVTFILAATRLARVPLVPEIALHLAEDARGIWQAAGDAFGDGRSAQPFWAFAWPGGQALARFLLDQPAHVRGRRVLDLGCGSGIAAIAARLAGAASVLAADVDPVAIAAARLNASANGVEIAVTDADLLGAAPGEELVLVGDLVYLPELALRVTAFLEAARRRGASILFADRTSARRPRLELALLAEHAAPVLPALIEGHVERARVWLA